MSLHIHVFIDSHAHLDKYHELEPVLDEIRKDQIITISNSMDIPSYKRNLEIANHCEIVVPTFGIHPWNASQYVESITELTKYIDQSPMLGEVGLDHYFIKDSTKFIDQQIIFEFFLKAALNQDKILNIHTKGAEKQVLQLLDQYKIKNAIIHWYSGPFDIFEELVSRKYFFTIGASVFNSKHIQKIAKRLRNSAILLTTFFTSEGIPILPITDLEPPGLSVSVRI